MGQFFGLGFSEGIIDEESNSIKTTKQYADSAVNALKSGINNRTPMKPMDFAINKYKQLNEQSILQNRRPTQRY